MTSLRLQDLHQLRGGRFGGKAEGLAKLTRAGLPVPVGFALSATTEPPKDWDEEARLAFAEHCRTLLSDGPIAVRSSAIGEDGTERSFAGLFRSVLQVKSEEEALVAAATGSAPESRSQA